jgi:hypothetical protein
MSIYPVNVDLYLQKIKPKNNEGRSIAKNAFRK